MQKAALFNEGGGDRSGLIGVREHIGEKTIKFSNQFTYMKRDDFNCIKTGLKCQYVLAASLKLYIDRLHSFHNLLTYLGHQTKGSTQKREKDMKVALNLLTNYSLTQWNLSSQINSQCLFFVTRGRESEDDPESD